MIFSIIAIVLIVGAVVTIVLLNRDNGTPAADNPPPSTPRSSGSAPKPPTSSSIPKTSGQPGDALQPRNTGWTVIKNDKAKFIYEVPPSWKPVPGATLSSKAMPDATLYFPASVGDYQCQGANYSRGGLGGGTVARADPTDVAISIAKAYGAEFYTSGNGVVTTGTPRTVKSVLGTDGKPQLGVQVDATIAATGNECFASKGKVSVLVIDNGGSTLQFLVVNGDVEGGPATPPPPADADLQKIVDSAREY
ncbi:hypothetical protein EV192_106300 [Actinocrispum wychmicini]|uniref:DUF8017 domain-containing protein n=2 Tax=Actinocrispum wychmicini TaxID=1213861 RepID=A0A4R2JRL0_9PSEU|nr:hypothetical protein EV192_106300 [Actinocrispum wychmicini]